MKHLIEGALKGAMKMVRPFMTEAVESANQMTESQMIERYDTLHRGNPVSMAQFVAQRMPPGADPMAEMRRYEAEMERLRKRGG